MKHHKHRTPREVVIDRIDAKGRGEGKDEGGRSWAIRGAPVGATVLAAGRNFDGVRLATVRPADDAVSPPCPVFGVCGGCQWQEMPVGRQREEKARMLGRMLGELAGTDHGMLHAGPEYGYRNKIELTFGTARYLLADELNTEIGRIGRWLGFHAPGRYDRIVDAPACALASPAINAVYQRIRADIMASDLPFWDADAHIGFFRNLVLRSGDLSKATTSLLIHPQGQVLVAVYTAPGDDAQAAWLREKAPRWGATCVGWFENAGPADAVGGELREVLVGGELAITDGISGLVFRLSPTAFFQANAIAAEEMVRVVREYLALDRPSSSDSRPTVLWDLYCGAGLLGLACAASFDEVVGIETVAAAVADAEANAVANAVHNARFVAGNVEHLVADLLATTPPDAVIVDPPRNGLHPDALAVLTRLARPSTGHAPPVLVYVACKPTSLLRDGRALIAAGWTCTDRVAIDLFPQTAHVEVVSRWIVNRSITPVGPPSP